MPEDTLPLALDPVPTAEAAASDAPAVPAPVVLAPAARRRALAQPTPPATPQADPRAEHFAALGIEPEQWNDYERHQAEYLAKLPEIERIRREHRNQTTQIETLRQQATEHKQRWESQVEQNFALLNRSLAADLARQIGLVPEPVAMNDLFQLLHGQQEGTADGAVLFREGNVEIDMSAPDRLKKLGEHIAKTRPHWLASRLAAGGGGAGGAGRPALGSVRQEPPKTRAGLVDHMMARIIAGGKQAAGGR